MTFLSIQFNSIRIRNLTSAILDLKYSLALALIYRWLLPLFGSFKIKITWDLKRKKKEISSLVFFFLTIVMISFVLTNVYINFQSLIRVNFKTYYLLAKSHTCIYNVTYLSFYIKINQIKLYLFYLINYSVKINWYFLYFFNSFFNLFYFLFFNKH